MRATTNLSLFFAFILTLFVSCDTESGYRSTLSEAREQIETNPGKALELLSAIERPELMPEELYMEYVVYAANAHHKLKIDNVGDTLIFRACDYFKDKGKHDLTALAYFNAGRYCKEHKKYDQSLECYLMAENFAKIIKNNILLGRINNNIGEIYFAQDIFDKAQKYYEESLSCFELESGTEIFQLMVKQSLFASSYYQKKYTKALDYVINGLEHTRSIKNKDFEATFLHQIGSVYKELKKYTEAESYLIEALDRTKNSEEKIRIKLSLAKLYILMKNSDKSFAYLKDIEDKLSTQDEYFKKELYEALANLYGQRNDIGEKSKYERLQFESSKKIQQALRQEDLYKAESNYKIELTKAEMDMRQKVYFCITMAVILVVLLSAYFFIKIAKTKREQKLLSKLEAEKITNELMKARMDYEAVRSISSELKGVGYDLLNYYVSLLFKLYDYSESLHFRQQEDLRRIVKEAMWQISIDLKRIGQMDLTEESGDRNFLKGFEDEEKLLIILQYNYIRDEKTALLLDIEDMNQKVAYIIEELEKRGVDENLIFRIFYYFEVD